MEKIEVQEFSLYAFLKRAQELFEEGYRFDFEKNENVPTSYGTLLVANMFKKSAEEATVETVSESAEPAAAPDEAPVVARKSAKAAKS